MVIIVDYSLNNIFSVKSSLDFMNIKCKVSNNPEEISKASHIILPGVGSFYAAMQNLKHNKIDIAIQDASKKGAQILGICLGMQLLAKIGYEDGVSDGIGLISSEVNEFDKTLIDKKKIPHVGFNNIKIENSNKLFKNIDDGSDFYFNHSYVINFKKKDKGIIFHKCEYGQEFVAAFEYNNINGTQFHPEKSQTNGLMLLKNFSNF